MLVSIVFWHDPYSDDMKVVGLALIGLLSMLRKYFTK